MMFQRSITSAFAAVVVMSLAASAPAQADSLLHGLAIEPASPELVSEEPDTDASAAVVTAEDTQELRATSSLNTQILDGNDLAEMEEQARQAEYQAQLRHVEAERLRIALEAEAQEERYRAERAAHARAIADWEACVAGDRSRCAK